MSKTKKIERSNEEHSSSSYTSSLSSSDEEIDPKDMKSIKEYLFNHKELARQLFKSVKPEKIRMMLPQILKQMDLNELEQWCVSELSGMSKTRILSILNNKPMLESSDTNESDNSGPSLEIISDTEECLTDTSKKETDEKKKLKKVKTQVKRKVQVDKANNLDKTNVKRKINNKKGNNDKSKDVKIKKEDDKDKEKDEKILLDLLELEMRAHAIRALIRKEDDVIPPTNLPQANSESSENNAKISQDDAKAKENCRKHIERFISAQEGNIGEDEDVVLVMQPTTVIELLSSDSEGENHRRTQINAKENECTVENEKSTSNSKERKETREISGTNTVIKTDNTKSETRAIMSERNVDIKNNTLSISISASNIANKRKKSKKRSHTKSQLTSSTNNVNKNSPKSKQNSTVENTEQSPDIKDQIINEQSMSPISDEKKVTAEEESSISEKIVKKCRMEDERSTDLDEIIDLDDYCDVMGIENSDEDKSEDETIVPSQPNKQPEPQAKTNQTESSETWASRYYQTDDVQNVIRESKVHSEIRKRLRERQRLSKLNKFSNINSPSQPLTIASEKTPTGSVEEYLALKCITNADANDNSNINNSDTVIVNSTIVSDNNTVNSTIVSDNNSIATDNCSNTITDVTNSNSNDTVQDNSTIIKSDNEISVKDESVSSFSVHTDHLNDTTNVNVSCCLSTDGITSGTTEDVTDKQNHTQV